MSEVRWACVPAGDVLRPMRGRKAMTLRELSETYEAAAVPLRARLRELRQMREKA